MKKLVSILLAVVMVASVCSVSAFAEVPPEDKFYDRFVEKYGDAMYYQEIQPHYDENGEIDWVVVCAYTEMAIVDPLPEATHSNCYMNGEFVFHSKDWFLPFEVGHCVYDPKKDEFIDITKVNFDEYKDLKKHVRTYYFANLIGDIDDDNDITIMDATEIQLIIAKLKEQYVEICVSDFDRDGELTVLDATAIQRNLAKVDEQPVVNEEMVFSDSSQSLSYMPWYAEALFFDYEYGRTQVHNSIYKPNKFNTSGNMIVIVKSNEQYTELFNEDAPVFDDDFFESKCLIVALVRTHGMNGSAYVNDVSKYGDTLYVQTLVHTPSGNLEPISPYWLIMVSVDKKLVSDVYNVVEVYDY